MRNLFFFLGVCVLCSSVSMAAQQELLLKRSVNPHDNSQSIEVYYDVVNNIPGSRKPNGSQSVGFKLLYRDTDHTEEFYSLHDTSFDSRFFVKWVENGLILVSSAEAILVIDGKQNTRFSVREVGAHFTIAGVSDVDNIVRLILAKKHLFRRGSQSFEDFKQEFRAITVSDKLAILANEKIDKSEAWEIFLESVSGTGVDLDRFVENNNEGRAAWYLPYTLPAAVTLYKMTRDDGYIEYVNKQLNMIYSQDSCEFLLSKRYSYERESQLFLIHLSRLYVTLRNLYSDTQGIDTALDESPKYLRELERGLLDRSMCGTKAVEELVLADQSILGCSTLYFRDDSAFWAAGSNVPVNYVSDYIRALVKMGTPETIRLANELFECNLASIPFFVEGVWGYWYGEGKTGWDDGTVVRHYKGDPSYHSADISYLTTDALSAIEVCKFNQISWCKELDARVIKLVENGVLLPSACKTSECDYNKIIAKGYYEVGTPLGVYEFINSAFNSTLFKE